MRSVTAVEGEWLADLGPMFFSVKRSYNGPPAKRLKDTANIGDTKKR